MTRPVRAVLWDLDGTLVDSEPLHIAALVAAMDRVGIAAPEGLHDRVIGMAADAVHAWLAAEHGLTLGFRDWIGLKYDAYLAGIGRVRPFDGALAVWSRLDALGVAQAVASNSDRIVVEANLARAGLRRPGLVSLARNDVRRGKPDPEIYLRASWLIGVDPAEALVVEDSATGARAGLAAGMPTLMLTHSGQPAPEGATPIGSHAEILARIGAGEPDRT